MQHQSIHLLICIPKLHVTYYGMGRWEEHQTTVLNTHTHTLDSFTQKNFSISPATHHLTSSLSHLCFIYAFHLYSYNLECVSF